mgnify:CR=1 FL=1
MSRHNAGLDPRAWLVWAAAASLPPLAGRNPFPLLAVLLSVLGVRAAWRGSAEPGQAWAGVVRLAALFALVATLFNALTVRAGTTELVRLPSWLPIVSGPVTLNAIVYGVLSGLALLCLVLVGALMGSVVDWAAVLRLIPDRLLTIAVASSIAIAFVPQTIAAFREIREAQMARGYRPRGLRDALPLLAPLLHGGLERATTLAEALESRAFGAPLDPRASLPSWRAWGIVVALTAGVTAGYALAVGQIALAAGSAGLAFFSVFAALGRGSGSARRTRYRPPQLGRNDVAVIAGSVLAGGATIAVLLADPAALRYEPYPRLSLPVAQPWFLLGQAGLLVPAFLAPSGEPVESIDPPVIVEQAPLQGTRS